MSVPPSDSLGPYRLETRLGGGASGAVWRARRTGPIDQAVAIKRLHHTGGREVDRLRREAAVLAELDHPHLVRVLDVIDDGDGIALVLQLATGGSLDVLLDERGTLEPGQAVAVLAPLADALASAHRREVIHGDVKPANVLFTSDGEALLSDFGVARLVGRSVTADHRVAGTAEYLAPELVDGTPAHPGSDIYGLGVLAYEALAGTTPYAGPTPLAVLRAADRGEHRPLTDVDGVPESLAAVVESAIARDPAERPASADELARALRNAVDPATIALPGLPQGGGTRPVDDTSRAGTRAFGPGPPPPPPAPPPPTPRRWPKVALGTGAAVVAGFAIARFGGDGDPTTTPCDEPSVEVPAGAQELRGDTTGRGCESVAVYAPDGDAMVLTVRIEPAPADPARYALGHPGDRLLLGDWNCDDLDTAALYEPDTGEVSYFDDWAPPRAQSTPTRTDQLPEGVDPEVGTGRDGCDVLVAPA